MSELNRYYKFYMRVDKKYNVFNYSLILYEKIFLSNKYSYVESNPFLKKVNKTHRV